MTTVRLKDVAAKAGLSIGTISQVLHRNDPRYSDTTKEYVRQVATELGYRPNLAAQALCTGRSHAIAVYLRQMYSFFNSWVLNGLESELERAGLQIIAKEALIPECSLNRPGGGILWPVDMTIFVDCGPNHPLTKTLKPKGPYVSVGACPDRSGDWIALDLYGGTLDAFQHLYEQGCRRIASISTYIPSTGAEELEPRMRAYHDFIDRSGLEPLFLMTSDFTPAAARTATIRHIRQEACPDAIFCHFDEVAIGVYRGLLDAGVRVPEDTLLMSCDGLEMLEYLACPISTIVMPVEEMCRQVCAFIEARIDNPTAAPMTMTLKPSLRIRESTRHSGTTVSVPDA